MSQSKFELNVPRSQLPLPKVKVFKYLGSTAELDVYQQFRGIGASINIINSDGANSVSVSIDDQPVFDLLAGDKMDLQVQFSKLNVTGTGTADFVISLIPQTLYLSSLEKLARVD